MAKIKDDDRREHARYAVFAGNAEIREVVGRRQPRDRARIVNWSRSGLCLRVPSPRRKFIFFTQEPIVHADDLLRCVLRLPPHYNDIDVSANVIRVERDPKDPDVIQVGLSFDPTTPADRIEAIAKLLEPRQPEPRQPEPSARVARASGKSGRAKKSQRLEPKRSSERPSQRLSMRPAESIELRSSGRQARQSGRL